MCKYATVTARSDGDPQAAAEYRANGGGLRAGFRAALLCTVMDCVVWVPLLVVVPGGPCARRLAFNRATHI
jgi:hypothetical protein